MGLIWASLCLGQSAVEVQTIGGGRLQPSGPDFGWVDGNILETSQFNAPSAIAVGPGGNLFVADSGNGALRVLNLAANRSGTLLRNLAEPVDVVADGASIVFLTRGDGRLWRLDQFNNVLPVSSPFLRPTAVGRDRAGRFYVAEEGGRLLRVTAESRSVIRTGLANPQGVAVLGSGHLAVTEAGAHRVVLIDPDTGAELERIGAGTGGFRDGDWGSALFDSPAKIQAAPNGTLLVADRGNHRLRQITPGGLVRTVYGVDPKQWEGPACVTCDPVVLPGWLDGPDTFAEAKQVAGVTIGPEGILYTTELGYHLVRRVVGMELDGGPTGGLAVQAPEVTPLSGYFPRGKTIQVTSRNENPFFSNSIYYTTDGTEPTTNDFRVPLGAAGTGTILWRNSREDLRSLRVKSFMGGVGSPVVSGRGPEENVIGFERDAVGDVGSMVVLPVVVNLRDGQRLESLQFRVEVSPLGGATPPLAGLRALPMSEDDFIPVTRATGQLPNTTVELMRPDGTRVLAVAYVGANEGFAVDPFAVAMMLELRIPSTASVGQRYRLDILEASGTGDGEQNDVDLVTLEARELVVANVAYLVGDSAPAHWYNAGELEGGLGAGFGDGRLRNSDVNNAFAAALGVRVPYASSDLFDAMDAFPPDEPGRAGGDGQIRFLDWQRILRLSLGLEAGLWSRTRDESGRRVPVGGVFNGAFQLEDGNGDEELPGAVWVRQAGVAAGTIAAAKPGARVAVPVRLRTRGDARVRGLQWRARVEPAAGGASLTERVSFEPATGLALPRLLMTERLDEVALGWDLGRMGSGFGGGTLLGHIRFTVPEAVSPGACYRVRFSHVDGAGDENTPYAMESWAGCVGVGSSAVPVSDSISDEWRERFFPGASPETADADADPDGDGHGNAWEYAAGTDPTRAESVLRVRIGAGGRELEWLSSPGVRYVVESGTIARGAEGWEKVAEVEGDGRWTRVLLGAEASMSLYRVRVEQ